MSMNRYIYDKVNALVKKYKTRDPLEIIEALNIHVFIFNNSTNLLGMYKFLLRNRYIFVSGDARVNKKTILAHELGHDQLHRNYIKNGSCFHENKVFNPTNTFETEANIFAAHLLISDEDIFSSLREGICDYELAGELEVDINLINLKISEMAKLGLLKENLNINVPRSDFLKNYKPEEDNFI